MSEEQIKKAVKELHEQHGVPLEEAEQILRNAVDLKFQEGKKPVEKKKAK